MPPQIVYEVTKVIIDDKPLENQEETYNIGIKESNNYVNSRLNKAQVGDIIGVKFEKEIPPTQKGRFPAKSLIPFIFGPDEEYKKKMEVDEARAAFDNF
jgi:hypothetical protein